MSSKSQQSRSRSSSPKNRQASPSPVRETRREKYQRKADDFSSEIKLFKQLFSNQQKLLLAFNSKSVGVGAEKVGKKELRSLGSSMNRHLDRFDKMFRASAAKQKKPVESDGQRGKSLSKLFYVSDQMIDFLLEANKGNGLLFALEADMETGKRLAGVNGSVRGNFAETSRHLNRAQQFSNEQFDVNATIGPLFGNERMANSTIIMSCLHLIVKASGLQSVDEGTRAHYDQVWEKHFGGRTTTSYLYKGTDLTQFLQGTDPRSLNADQQERRDVYLREHRKSAFQRLQEESDPKSSKQGAPPTKSLVLRGQEPRGTDAWGIVYTRFMTLISYFRIPDYLTMQMNEALSDPKNVSQAVTISSYIAQLKTSHNLLAEPEKKARTAEANRLKRASAAGGKF